MTGKDGIQIKGPTTRPEKTRKETSWQGMHVVMEPKENGHTSRLRRRRARSTKRKLAA